MTKKQLANREEAAADGSPSGVEEETLITFAEPFDPAAISIEAKVVPMDTLLRRLKQKTIRLAPSFQRKFVWDQARSSQLIESLMLRIPLPMFYVAASEDGSWDVVDGLQRLTTIRNYILGEDDSVEDAEAFSLQKLEFWGARFNNKKFSDISGDARNARILNNIMEAEMRFTVINPGTPEEVKRNIFKRINTGGIPLTVQEIRHAIYQGHSTELLHTLVELDEFKNAVDNSVDDSRMVGRELIIRFLAFYLFGSKQYHGDMDKFLSDAMRIINCGEKPDMQTLAKIIQGYMPDKKYVYSRESLINAFKLSVKRSLKFFGKYAFRKAIYGQRRTPVNKALFEAWTSIFARLSEDQFSKLYEEKRFFMEKYKQLLQSEDFDRAISRDASSISGVRERYKLLSALIKETLGEL